MKNTPGRNFGVMDIDLYKKIIDDICEFEHPIRVLRLYKDGEPLLNKHFPEMIRYAREQKCSDRIDTTTNASILTPEKSAAIIEAGGLDRINISIYGMNKTQYQNFSGFNIDMEKLISYVRFFYENKDDNCEMIVKITGDLIAPEDHQRFYDTFGDIADGVFIEHVMSCWPEFELRGDVQANQEFGIYGQKIKEVMTCPYIFYSFSLNSDGSASTCFLDWSRDLIIGDAKNESVKEIWFGDKMKAFRKMMLEQKRKGHPVCGNCGQMTHGNPDNIDPFAKELLAKL